MFLIYQNPGQEDEVKNPTRRYPKSGGFRRSMKSGDWVWLSRIMEVAKQDQGNPDEKLAPEPSTQESSRLCAHTAADIELDADGWPLMFSKVLSQKGKHQELVKPTEDAKTLSTSHSTASITSCASEASTVLFDEEGFPCFVGQQKKSMFVDGDFDDQTEKIQPIICRTKARKYAAAQQREQHDDEKTDKTPTKRQSKHATTPKSSSKRQRKQNPASVTTTSTKLILGCSKCRYQKMGCAQCKNPMFRGQRGCPKGL